MIGMSNYVNSDVIPVDEYDGLSTNIIKMMLSSIFASTSMVRLREDIDDETRKGVPVFKIVRDYLKILEREGEIKLTKIGNLPPKYVKEIYEVNNIKEFMIEKGHSKLSNEQDSIGVQLARILGELARYTKIRKNILSLTKAGKDILKDEERLFDSVIKTFTTGFNWGYFDGYEQKVDVSEFISFSYYLVGKYGDVKKDFNFYSDTVIKAFPIILDMINKDNFSDERDIFDSIYFLRTFERYMEFLGVVECKTYRSERTIRKTELFDKLIDLTPIEKMKMANQMEIKEKIYGV